MLTRSKATEGDRAERSRSSRERWLRPVLGALLALPAVVGAWFWYHPTVRIINPSGRLLVVLVDGRALAQIPPISAETPNTGVSIRLAAGTRELSARDDENREVDRATVEVAPGREHLWAPAHGVRCFFVETTSYGSAASTQQSSTPLDPSETFWQLPADIDAWFEPNPRPEPLRKAAPWSGGVLHAVREGDCHLGADTPRDQPY